MAAIRSRGNRSTERSFAALLRCRHIAGWTLHAADIPGRPDFFFRAHALAVFLDGCFWHRCRRCYQAPRHNAAFWERKIGGNCRRDRAVDRRLQRQGIRVIRIWEHDVERRTQRLEKVLDRLRALQ